MKLLNEKSNALKLFNKLNEGIDKIAKAKEIMASLGINEIYFSDEHKPSREYDTRIPNAYKYVDFYGYAYVSHDTLGNFYISYKVGGRKNIIDTSGFPWEGIEKNTTEEQKSFIEDNYEALSELFVLCKGQVGVSLNESEEVFDTENAIDKIAKYMENANLSAKDILKEISQYVDDSVFFELLRNYEEYNSYINNKDLNEGVEPSNLELDENGLPALDAPYYMQWLDDNDWDEGIYYITSAHPYNDAEYSYAYSKEPDYIGYWNVYTPERKLVGTVEGYEEAVRLMKELDAKVEPRMMYN